MSTEAQCLLIADWFERERQLHGLTIHATVLRALAVWSGPTVSENTPLWSTLYHGVLITMSRSMESLQYWRCLLLLPVPAP